MQMDNQGDVAKTCCLRRLRCNFLPLNDDRMIKPIVEYLGGGLDVKFCSLSHGQFNDGTTKMDKWEEFMRGERTEDKRDRSLLQLNKWKLTSVFTWAWTRVESGSLDHPLC